MQDSRGKAEDDACSSLLAFTLYTYPTYQVNWHHRVICEHLDDFVAGKIKRLMVFAPPRSGKSELVSRRLPAFILGQRPDTTIIATSYGADLARRMNRDVQRIMDEDAYRKLFPDTKLWGKNVRSDAQGSWLRNSDMFEVVGHRGYYLGTGVGGSITGSGAHCLTGETSVRTEMGNIAISNLFMLQYHPRVWAFDHESNAPVLRRIVAVKESYSDDILEIVTVSGRSIKATAEHRFYVHGRGYQEAALLCPGDQIQAVEIEQDVWDLRKDQGNGKPRHDVQRLLHANQGHQGIIGLRMVRQGVRAPFVRTRKVLKARKARGFLLQGLSVRQQQLQEGRCGKSHLPSLRYSLGCYARPILFSSLQGGLSKEEERVRGSYLPLVRSNVFAGNKSQAVLFQGVRECRSFSTDARQGKLALQNGDQLREMVCGNAPVDYGARRASLRGVPDVGTDERRYVEGPRSRSLEPNYSSHQRRPHRQYPPESGHAVQDLPCRAPQVGTDTVAVVRRLCTGKIPVYDIQVEGTHNFFAEGVLTHNCVIIDDPVKNRKEANSPTYRQSVFEWYTSTLYTRLTPDGQILLTVTRWSEDDLAGRLLALSKSDPEADQWTTLILPAVSEEPIAPYDERKEAGKPLWADRWGIDKLRTIERTVGSRDWASLYQQRPAPDEGEIFKRHHWRYWQPRGANLPPVTVTMGDGSVIEVEPVELPARFDELLQSWDMAFKDTAGSDFVAGMVLGRLGADKFILDYANDRMDIVASMDAVTHWAIKWPKAIAKLIEDKANGPAVIQMLRKKMAGLIPREPQGGKVSRAYAAQPEVQSGNVYLPHPHIAPWTAQFIANAAAFPNAAHDDDVDAFTQAIIYWQEAGSVATAPAQVTSQATIQEMFG
jgi:predicted phage terminase large subunit-like protein